MSLIGNGKTQVISDLLKANIPNKLMSGDIKSKFVNQILKTVIQLKGNPVNLDVATKAVDKINFKDIYGSKFNLIRENLKDLKSVIAKTVVMLMENESFLKEIEEDEDEMEEKKWKKSKKNKKRNKDKDEYEDEDEEDNEDEDEYEDEDEEDNKENDLSSPDFSIEKVKEILSNQDMEEFSEYLVKLMNTIQDLQSKLDLEKEKTAEAMYSVSDVEDQKEKMKENFEKRIDAISTIVALKTLKEAKRQLIENSEVSSEVKVLEKIRQSMDSAYASLLKEIEELKVENDKLKSTIKLKESLQRKIKLDKKHSTVSTKKANKRSVTEKRILINKLRNKLYKKINEDKEHIRNRKNLIESRKNQLKSDLHLKENEKRNLNQKLTEENEAKKKTINKLDTLLD